MNEPTSHVNPSDDARVVKPGVYLTTDTATQAFYWRLRIEEYARLTILPLAKERGEKEHDSKEVGDENAMTLIGLLNVVPSTSIMAKDSGPYG
jgi:hypothetical protein